MSARVLIAASAATLVALAAVSAAAPASAAGGGDPKIRVRSTETVQENEVTVLDVEYRCATGHSASLSASLRQGGTAAHPRSLFDTSFAALPPLPLTCDGDRHTAHVALILVGWNDDYTSEPPGNQFLVDTSQGGGRATATATLTDLTTGHVDVDVDRLDVVSR
jgi:hypothetical protein